MRHQFEQCINKGKIVKIEKDPDLISKEMKEAENDLSAAEKSIKERNFKWAIIQGYYSMFHSLRALLFTRGYREKSHTCLKFAIEAIFVDSGVLDRKLLQDFDYSMKIRKRADYGYTYSEDSAKGIIDSAREIYEASQRLIVM